MSHRLAQQPANIDCEVYLDHTWQPGLLVSTTGDGWARVLVECAGRIRELTFSPKTLRLPSPPKGSSRA